MRSAALDLTTMIASNLKNAGIKQSAEHAAQLVSALISVIDERIAAALKHEVSVARELCQKCLGHQTSTDAGNQPCKACGGTGFGSDPASPAADTVIPEIKPSAFYFSAKDFALATKLSVQSVRNLEREGKLFSVISPLRQRGRLYPTFLAWADLMGSELLKVMNGMTGQQKLKFLLTPSADLEGLTPLVVWQGSSCGKITWGQQEYLERPQQFRHSQVMTLAVGVCTRAPHYPENSKKTVRRAKKS